MPLSDYILFKSNSFELLSDIVDVFRGEAPPFLFYYRAIDVNVFLGIETFFPESGMKAGERQSKAISLDIG